jgi:hypothetical protein
MNFDQAFGIERRPGQMTDDASTDEGIQLPPSEPQTADRSAVESG